MAQTPATLSFAQSDVEEFAQFSGIPTINALTDDEHPCQILTDIFTFEEKRGPSKDGSSLSSAMARVTSRLVDFAAAKLDFELRIAAPKAYQPPAAVLNRAGGKVVCTEDIKAAAKGADLLYTDVWVSMGKEAESTERLSSLQDIRSTGRSVQLAKADALVMHCLPAYRARRSMNKRLKQMRRPFSIRPKIASMCKRRF